MLKTWRLSFLDSRKPLGVKDSCNDRVVSLKSKTTNVGQPFAVRVHRKNNSASQRHARVHAMQTLCTQRFSRHWVL